MCLQLVWSSSLLLFLTRDFLLQFEISNIVSDETVQLEEHGVWPHTHYTYAVLFDFSRFFYISWLFHKIFLITFKFLCIIVSLRTEYYELHALNI